jgi:hypothetical protein
MRPLSPHAPTLPALIYCAHARLAFTGADQLTRGVRLTTAWQLKFSNMISAETENENCTLGMEDAKPVIRYNLITKGTFQHTFKLKSFPFDDQTLAMELRTGFEHNHKKTPVKLMQNQDQHKYRSTVVTRGFTQASEYELLPGVRFQGGETEKEESSTGLTYSLLTIKLKVHRKSGYWVFNVVLPLGIVTSTLFATFSLPLTETNDRLNSSLTILLAMVAFKTFTAEKLPKVAYLSLVDWFILLSFVIAFVVVLMHAFFRCSSRPECMLRASVGANESRFFYRDPLYSSGDDDPLGNGYPCALVIGLGCYTVIIGLLLLGLTFCWRRGRKDWTDIENALWISPVRAEQGMGDKEIEEAVQEQLRAAALPEGKKPCVKVWTTSKAKEELKKREKELNSMFSLGKDAMGEAPFVVVTFANKEARDAALSEEKELCKNFREKYPKIFDSKCKIQPLQPTWYALSKTKGDTPTSTRMNTRKGYGSLAGYFLKGDPNVKLGLGSSTKLTASGKSPKLKGGVQTRMMTPSGPEPPATRQLSNDI